ncbi:MAG TPA: HEPN domain-containing protein [Rhodocyclaceae bacterium]|nr:HEPN domain-containing protein [Rhodocyclaceae bacterium]
MSDLEQAQSLVILARRDFNALTGMVAGAPFADEIFGFHAQQAIEKALKAWLTVRSTNFPLTHDLTRLLSLLEGAGENVESFWPLVQYNVYAVQARYEAGLADEDVPLDRHATLAEVKAVIDHIEAILGAAYNRN